MEVNQLVKSMSESPISIDVCVCENIRIIRNQIKAIKKELNYSLIRIGKLHFFINSGLETYLT